MRTKRWATIPNREVWSERIGYVAVQLSESLREATLLGFVEQVTTKELPISQLRSLEDLREHINQLGQPQPAVQLSQWQHNIFDAGWETVEALLEPQELAFRFRSSHRMKTSSPENPADGVKRGKLLDLERAGEEGKQTKQIISSVLRLAPHGADTHELLAYYHLLRGEWAKGVKVLQQFTEEHPNHPRGWYSYGRCLFHTGEYQKAALVMLKAYFLYPKDCETVANYGAKGLWFLRLVS